MVKCSNFVLYKLQGVYLDSSNRLVIADESESCKRDTTSATGVPVISVHTHTYTQTNTHILMHTQIHTLKP